MILYATYNSLADLHDDPGIYEKWKIVLIALMAFTKVYCWIDVKCDRTKL